MEKSQVFVYEIPPNYRIRGLSQRAADWNIGQPVWFGKLLIHKIGQWRCHLELRDVDGRIYGSASIRDYPSRDFEPVIDSSRYFTLGMSDSDGNVQLVGIGFVDRRDSSDVHHVVEDLFLTLLSNNNNEDTIAKTETQRTEEVFPVNAIMTQNEPVVEMLLETPVLSIDEPLEVESVEENSKTVGDLIMQTGVINKEATASPMRDTFADDILLEEVQFSKPSTEIKELEEMTDNVLVHDEVQVYHPWPEPQIPEKLNQTRISERHMPIRKQLVLIYSPQPPIMTIAFINTPPLQSRRSHRWLHIKEKHDVLGKGKLREVVTSCPECNVVPANTSELRKHVRSDHRYPKKRASKLTMDPPTHVHETKNSPFISKSLPNKMPNRTCITKPFVQQSLLRFFWYED
ncbi:unnamed protein product [Allacma fusca]|uniref:NECAP PHear domain-containing protein n=1 Tax=Allacma fusca TaxID=39272 RepID=A0A8J2LXH4_9HEXA|nr:unnamed protein product [Allacma fusca]